MDLKFRTLKKSVQESDTDLHDLIREVQEDYRDMYDEVDTLKPHHPDDD